MARAKVRAAATILHCCSLPPDHFVVNPPRESLYNALAKAIYLAAAVVIFILVLWRIEAVLTATLLALILAIALNAPVTWLEKKGVSRVAGTLISFFAFLLISVAGGSLVIPRLAAELPALIEQMPELVEAVSGTITAWFGDHPEVQRQTGRVIDWGLGVFEGLWRYADVVAGGLLLTLFMVALVLYMVVYFPAILRWYVHSMAPHLRDPATRAFAGASKMVIGWVIASVILGGIKAVAAFFFLTFIGVPGAILWASIAFFGAFIPRVGFYLMTIPPVLVAFTVDPLTALYTLIFYVVFSEFLGNFVAPYIYAETMYLNPVLVLFMTVAMGYAFGVIGVLIAAPVAGFLKAYYDEFYLARRPEDPDMERRVRAMMQRDPDHGTG
jgi:putative permease